MKLNPHRCPGCGKVAAGTVDWVPATGHLRRAGLVSEFEPFGESKMHWDGQLNDVEVIRSNADPGGLLAALRKARRTIYRCGEAMNTPMFDELSAIDEAIARHKAAVPAKGLIRVQCADGHQWDAAVEGGEG